MGVVQGELPEYPKGSGVIVEPKVLTGKIQPSAFTQESVHSNTRFAFLVKVGAN